jgi:hypothetical protein
VTLGNAGETDSGAALTSAGSIYVGGDQYGDLGTGVINVYPGTTLSTGGTLKIWNSSGTSVNLAGGTIKVATLDTSSNASLFNWTAGTLAVTGSNINTPSITVPSTGKLVFEPNSNAPITLNNLSISPGGIADVGNYQFFVNYGSGSDPISTIAGYLKTGYANGAWNGSGIDSSAAAANPGYALGYADGAEGTVAGLSSGQIEIKYTLLGDANLDGSVTGNDFTILIGNFGKSFLPNGNAVGWDDGDFEYSGSVTGNDFTDLLGNLGKTAQGTAVVLPASDWAAVDAFAAANDLMADVPEPASAGLAVIAAMGALARRRRR